MKQNLILNILMMTTTVTLVSCYNSDGIVETEEDENIYLLNGTDIKLTEEQSELAAKTNNFAFNLLRSANNLQTKKNVSLLISPISVTYVLGMLNSGATGETAKEITSIIGSKESDTKTVNEFCNRIITETPKTDPNVVFNVANYIAVNKDYKLVFDKQFEEDMHNFYKAELATLDFNSPSDLNIIDNWCNTHTDGLIPKMSDLISPTNMIAFLNATYFKAAWYKKFYKKNTRTEIFYAEDGKQKKVDMMHQKFYGQYWANNLYTTLCLPYGSGQNWDMYILLPNKGKTSDDIINSLTKDNWDSNHTFTTSSIIDTKVPRFTTNNEIDLKPIIEKMGAPIIFKNEAEFYGMFTNSKQIKVDKLIQRNLTTVNEEGAEAAAVTLASMVSGAAGGSSNDKLQEVDFHCDHPFVYFIKESSSDIIFFIGVYRGE